MSTPIRTPEQEHELHAERVAWHAARVVAAVHEQDPATAVHVMAAVPEGDYVGLIVALAAMVDPDKTPGELLAWTEPLGSTA